MADLTRRGFLETLVVGTGIAAGAGLLGLLEGCESGQQPTWKEAKRRYEQAHQAQQRVHVGNWVDYHRWLGEQGGLTEQEKFDAKLPVFELWIATEQGENPQEGYGEIVVPGIRNFIDFTYRRTMEESDDRKRYDLAVRFVNELDGLLFEIDDQIRSGTLGAVFPASSLERSAMGYHRPERMRIDGYKESLAIHRRRNMNSFTEPFSLTDGEYRNLMQALTAGPDLPILKTTYGL